MSDIEQEKLNVASGPQGLSRRRFIQGVAATGIGAGLVGLAACGGDSDGATTDSDTATDGGSSTAGGTLRIAIGTIANPPTPYTTNDQGSLQILGCVGEYLAWENDKGEIEPRVAESWESTDGGTTWTYKIRPGITFHDGSPLTADDVVWTLQGHLNPDNASNQAGKFAGILTAEGVTKVDDTTVQIVCDKPTGAIPNLLSSTSYGLVIIKNGDVGGDGWQATMNSCGPWVLESYTEGTGATFTKNANYWDSNRQPAFDALQLTSFEEDEVAVQQLAAGELDVVAFASGSTVATVDTAVADLVRVPSSAHLSVHLRNDFGPFQDKRVRRAAALCLARADFLSGVLGGEGVIGNDSIIDAYPTLKDTTIAQREADVEAAKALMAEAGVTDGFEVELSSYVRSDIVLLAPYLQAALAPINIKVKIVLSGSYYSPPWSAQESKKAENNIWLESNFGITDFGHRGSPDEVLNRVFRSTGDWNAAQYKSDAMDAAIDAFLTGGTPDERKAAAKTIQEISLEDTPYLLLYFQTAIAVVKKGLTGFYTNGMGQFESAAVRTA